MQIEKCSLGETNQFSPLFLDYIARKPELSDFYNQFPDNEGFEKIIKGRKFSLDARNMLAEVLQQQYIGIENSPNFEKLKNANTFTVTTGHQLNIFTGPLYVIYKIISTINLAKQLKAKFPTFDFVPVYWMASEDHDFEEINHFNIFSKKYTWKTDQKGAVGRMNLKEFPAFLETLPDTLPIFEKAYRNSATLAEAVRIYMHELFGEKGLVVIDADDIALKSGFVEVIEKDILGNESILNEVVNTTAQIEKLGYKTQVHAREINFFYLINGLRERVIKKGNYFEINNTEIRFSELDIRDLIKTNPERFSPNVILRPVYQEVILPNIAYLGGPAEIVYWLQLKSNFDSLAVDFPILLPRNFAMVVSEKIGQKLGKLGIANNQLFEDISNLKKDYILKNTKNILSLDAEKQKIKNLFQQILQHSKSIDNTLEGAVLAQEHRIEKGMNRLEKKLIKAEERNHETSLKQLVASKEALFPNQNPQERVDNFLNIYLENPNFIDELLEVFDPLEFSYYLIKT